MKTSAEIMHDRLATLDGLKEKALSQREALDRVCAAVARYSEWSQEQGWWDATVGLSYDIDITFLAKDKLYAQRMLAELRREGFKETRPPDIAGVSKYIQYHWDGVEVLAIFSGGTCQFVQTGEEQVTKPIYELRCDETEEL